MNPGLNPWGGLDEKYQGLCDRMDSLSAALAALELSFPKNDQQRSPGQQAWQRFALIDGGKCDGSGNLTIGGGGSKLFPAANGWEAYITSVAVTVSGASSAATVVNYNGEVSEQNLFDYANSILGNSPSRIIAFYDKETVYVEQGDPINIVIAGAAASASVYVRVCGKRRQT